MSFDRNADAILRYLEDHPQDAAARAALHDCLLEEGRDEVLAAGVHWLVVNEVWPQRTAGGSGYAIHFHDRDYGLNRPPFNASVTAPTLADCLRVFSAYLWGLKVWMAEFFGDRPVRAGKVDLQEPMAPSVPSPAPGIPLPTPEEAAAIRDMWDEMVGRHRVDRPWGIRRVGPVGKWSTAEGM